MSAATAALIPFAVTSGRFERDERGKLLAGYAGYLGVMSCSVSGIF